MREPAFTPGPWHLHDMENATVCGPDHEAIACCEARRRKGSTNDANARLIAASPRLYAALERVVAIADRQTVEFDEARAALKQASGEDA